MFCAPLSVSVALLLSPASAPVSGADEVIRPPSTDELFVDLVASEWQRVEYAKLNLVSRQKEPIPRLIALMSDDARVPLTETGDLIYPGAKEFYGHGFIVDYDLDVMAVRAGWVLEDLTFQDFGFRARQIREDALLRDTAMHGFETRPLNGVVPVVSAETESVQKAVAAARTWWSANEQGWSRMDALEEALRGTNASRHMAALGYLRYGDTICEGLDLDSYAARLLPLVRKLARKGDPEVIQQAKLLLESGFSMRP